MITDFNLYLVTGEEYSLGRGTHGVVKDSLVGGVDIVQMREKSLSEEGRLTLGIELATLCKENNAIFIVNDDPFIAKDVSADGVHLGQEDILKYPIDRARKIIGRNKIIGISTHSFDQFVSANNSDADYIAYGPIFPTKTKDYSIGLGEIGRVLETAVKPVIFIGGIDMDNIDQILDRGGRNIAVIRGITQADDITGKTIKLKEKIISKKKIAV